MKKLIFLVSLIYSIPVAAYAQAPGESFFDKYVPIAKLFDSPLFFNIVIGSAVLFVVFSVFFLWYVKKMEERAYTWGKEKKPEDLVELLDSPIPYESRLAFTYLRNHGDEKAVSCLINKLKEQYKKGKINPSVIYLLEDLEAISAIPTLQMVAKGKSQSAEIAQQALARIQETEETEQEPSPAKS